MELTISMDMLCRIVLRAREYEAQVPTTDPDDSSSGIDDDMRTVLEDSENTSVEEELSSAIEDLNEDEQAELIALALVGRGSYEPGEWTEALSAASDEVSDVTRFLMELPMLSAYLEAGLAAFDLSCDNVGRLG